jgi:[acyl-carrier-protein] S-malonyltransferase
MKPVQDRLAAEMQDVSWREPEVPLASNASGGIVRTGEETCEALVAQIASPVLWVECVRTLAGAGCTTFLELGSGRVLSGLVRHILGAEADTAAVDAPEKLASFVESRPQLTTAP